MNKLLLAAFTLSSLVALVQCSKKEPGLNLPTQTGQLTYGDSVFYLKPGIARYRISPALGRQGKYTAVPNNLQIDENTGEITVELEGKNNTSQTGLWYKIYFESNSHLKDSTMIMISGVNYVDEFYEYKKNGIGDTIISPVYNGKRGERLPKGNFWIEQNDFSSIINPVNGDINIGKFFAAANKARGVNADSPWELLTVRYQLDDKSEKSVNQMEILLYHYYTERSGIPGNVTEAMNVHRAQTFKLNLAPLQTTRGASENLPSVLLASLSGGRTLKPRPPCVVIVGN